MQHGGAQHVRVADPGPAHQHLERLEQVLDVRRPGRAPLSPWQRTANATAFATASQVAAGSRRRSSGSVRSQVCQSVKSSTATVNPSTGPGVHRKVGARDRYSGFRAHTTTACSCAGARPRARSR